MRLILNIIIEDLKEYFSKSSIYIDTNSTDDNKIRLGCSRTKTYLNLYWEDIFSLFKEKSFEGINSFIHCNGLINRMANIERLFGYISNEMLYSYHNKDLKVWGYKLNSYKDRYVQGFYKDNYAEFIIGTQSEEVSLEDLVFNFQIGNGVSI